MSAPRSEQTFLVSGYVDPWAKVITLSLSTGDEPQLTEWPFNVFSQLKDIDEPSQ